MTVDPSDPMANPGRRLAEARKLKRAKRLADPAYLALLRERFSRDSTAVWWPTPPSHTDAETMQYFGRIELEAANQDDEEAPDGNRSHREDVSAFREARGDGPT